MRGDQTIYPTCHSAQEILLYECVTHGSCDPAGGFQPLSLLSHSRLIRQAEDTLYRVSIHALVQRSDFFAATFSIKGIADATEGSSDESPIFLPSTVTCADFDVFLRSEVE